jgi:hypothetical protein
MVRVRPGETGRGGIGQFLLRQEHQRVHLDDTGLAYPGQFLFPQTAVFMQFPGKRGQV